MPLSPTPVDVPKADRENPVIDGQEHRGTGDAGNQVVGLCAHLLLDEGNPAGPAGEDLADQ